MLIDTHAHLDEQAFETDLADVLERARGAGVERILTIGVTLATSENALLLAKQHPHVHAVVGIQPNYVSAAAPGDFDVITGLATDPHVVAIGETGLDRYWDWSPLELQRDYFRKHLELSLRVQKPFVVHCRDAEAEVVEVLREFACGGSLNGVMHSYSGGWGTAEQCLEMGLHLSFAGMVTYKSNAVLRDVAQRTPLDRILVETDSPYLAPTPLRGKRNEPAHVVHTARLLAELHGLTLEDFAARTTENARRLFSLPS